MLGNISDKECVSSDLSGADAEEVVQQKPYHGIQDLTLEELKKEAGVTDKQLDMEISESDLPSLASCFDTTVGYVEALGLSPGEQTDVNLKQQVHGTMGGMLLALKCWKRKTSKASFRALVIIALDMRGGEVAVQISRCTKRNGTGEVQDSVHPVLAFYRAYVQALYKTETPRSSSDWLPVHTTRIFKLAMIEKENQQNGKINENFVRWVITGKIDDILEESKAPVDLEDIFKDIKEERKFVLLEGAPGSGKSTLTLNICQRWAKGSLFQEYIVVVLVKLRDPQLVNASSIADLLPCVDDEMANEVEAAMKSVLGSGVLWVLDGWDERPQDLNEESIINSIVFPGSSRKCPLPKCSVIVTSRPSSSVGLHRHVSLRVEVLGFTPEEQEQFFTECLKNNPEAVKDLLERIRQNPVVEGSCYLPLNASIVAHVYITGELPTSNTGIIISLVKCILKRYLKDKLKVGSPVGDITNTASLAEEIRTPFVSLCKIAFLGSKKNQSTFTVDNLKALSIPVDNIFDIGLLQSTHSMMADGMLVYYCFLHLSIQDLLTAIHISHLPSKDQISIFNALFDNPRFSAVFQFYAGITKLRVKRPILKKLPHVLRPSWASIKDLVRKLAVDDRNFLSILHCIYESEDASSAIAVAEVRKQNLPQGNLVLYRLTLNPLDCLCLGYYLSLVCTTGVSPYVAYIDRCSIGDQGSKLLTRGLFKNLTRPHSNVTAPLELHIERSCITEHGIRYLSEVLASTDLITKLDLSGNKIGEVGFWSICKALSTNTSLKALDLCNCSLPTCSNMQAMQEFLNKNSSLNVLDLNYNQIQDASVLLELRGLKKITLSWNPIAEWSEFVGCLSRHTSLKDLNLAHCGITDAHLEELCVGFNNHLKELDITDNDNITTFGLMKLLNRLKNLTNFRILWLPKGLMGRVSECWAAVSERNTPLNFAVNPQLFNL